MENAHIGNGTGTQELLKGVKTSAVKVFVMPSALFGYLNYGSFLISCYLHLACKLATEDVRHTMVKSKEK